MLSLVRHLVIQKQIKLDVDLMDDSTGKYVLHFLAEEDPDNAIHFINEQGHHVNVHKKDNSGKIPYDYACKKSYKRLTALLIQLMDTDK